MRTSAYGTKSKIRYEFGTNHGANRNKIIPTRVSAAARSTNARPIGPLVFLIEATVPRTPPSTPIKPPPTAPTQAI